MISRAFAAVVVLSTIPVVAPVQPSSSTCNATATSLTAASWRMPTPATQKAPTSALKLAREVPLPEPASRFDYCSRDRHSSIKVVVLRVIGRSFCRGFSRNVDSFFEDRLSRG